MTFGIERLGYKTPTVLFLLFFFLLIHNSFLPSHGVGGHSAMLDVPKDKIFHGHEILYFFFSFETTSSVYHELYPGLLFSRAINKLSSPASSLSRVLKIDSISSTSSSQNRRHVQITALCRLRYKTKRRKEQCSLALGAGLR